MALSFRTCRHWTQKSSNWPLVATACLKSSAVERSVDTNLEYEHALPYSSIPGPKGVPWFGKWWDYKLNRSKINRRDLVLKELYTNYGDIVKETVAGRDIIHLFHPDFLKQIYESEPKFPVIPPLLETVQFYRQEKLLAPGLGNSNGEDWYRVRSVVQVVMLRPHRALDYLPNQNKVANDFVDKIGSLIEENGEISNFNCWVARWGIESSANNCFDKRMGYMEPHGMADGDKIIEANNAVFDLSVKLDFGLPLYKMFPTPSIKKLFECEDFINDEGRRLLNMALKEYKEAVENGTLTEDRFKFLTYMLSNKHVSEKDWQAVILSVLTDTLSTTTQALLFNLYLLATNPSAQEKAYQEAKAILTTSGELTADGFNSSTYIKSCMKETFRLLPIGYDVLRLSPSNVVIGGYQIPEGTFLSLNTSVYPMHPSVIPQPDSFLPERWLREESEQEKINPYLLIPFSLGRRMCAGRRIAEQELVTLISKILTRYRLEWHHGELHQRFRLLCVPDQDVRIKFIPR